MFKRIIWWTTGAVMGVAGSTLAQRKVKRQLRATAERFTPPAVADRARKRLRSTALSLVDDVRDAIEDGRDAAADRQTELRQRISGSAPVMTDDHRASDHRASVIELHPGHPSGPRQSGSRESGSQVGTSSSGRPWFERLRRRS